MTRRKLMMGQRSREEGNSSTMWELPSHWTAAQALAVSEVLDDLRDRVVDGYAKKIQQTARLDRNVTTPFLPANMDDGMWISRSGIGLKRVHVFTNWSHQSRHLVCELRNPDARSIAIRPRFQTAANGNPRKSFDAAAYN